ncbi:MAG TPA: NACHT domain-containing protein [Longimicrobium sp.]|nr:NACHT domain-containing protein [Longimicrobium sp.]
MPDITQNVTVSGSSNQVFVAGGDIRYEVFYELPPASAEDRRHLLELLERVRRQWIVSVLEAAVKDAALLEVGMQAEPRTEVERPWTREQQAVGGRPEVRPPGTGIGEVFEDAGRTLLILGQPGAGKTIALLALAREWAGRAVRDPFAPVPVVFNLSSWSASRRSIHDWMVHELAQHYRTGEELARRWLKERRLLLLFDGLDEVVAERRAACVEAIDAFVHGCGIPGLAVCCRRDEYLELPVQLNVGGAVTLLPLTGEQIDAYVAAAGDGLSGVRSALTENAGLRALAESPLMLNVITAAFAGVPAHELKFEDARTRHALRDTIFARYVERMYGRRERRESGFSWRKTDGSLRWLACGMMRRGETIFSVELLQPAWLPPRRLLLYTLLSRVAGGVVMAVAVGAVVCLGLFSLYLIVSVSARGPSVFPTASTVAGVITAYLGAAMVVGLVAGLFYVPADYLRLRRSRTVRRGELSIIRELSVFLAYSAITVLAALAVAAVGTRGFGLSPRVPHMWAAVVTIAASILSFPLLFTQRAGRGTVDGDISLAGTLRWRWRSALELGVIGALAGVIVVLFPGRFEATRGMVAALAVIVTVTLVGYGSWRHELPPAERWRRRGSGATLLFDSGRFFLFAALAPVVAGTPLLALSGTPLRVAAAAMLLAGIALSAPALFWFGGVDVVLHWALRLVLALDGAVPLRLRRFLDYGVHLGFLRRAGGGYIFIHRLLLEHFAARAAPDASARGAG